MTDPIIVIPCSGIGKAFGTIARDATYSVVEDLKKGTTETICLSLLVMGDEEAGRLVKSHRCIAVDGCPNECSKKNLVLSGAKLAANFRVVDILRDHRDLKPSAVTFIDEAGRKLAKILADKISTRIDELDQEGRVSK
ncbi:MAG: hypothetical protein QG670_333 [Thermoproteota archaeon]|nr:hypothetical protein [Thermoproteota archaeon]